MDIFILKEFRLPGTNRASTLQFHPFHRRCAIQNLHRFPLWPSLSLIRSGAQKHYSISNFCLLSTAAPCIAVAREYTIYILNMHQRKCSMRIPFGALLRAVAFHHFQTKFPGMELRKFNLWKMLLIKLVCASVCVCTMHCVHCFVIILEKNVLVLSTIEWVMRIPLAIMHNIGELPFAVIA